MLSKFIERLQKLHREEGDGQVVIDRAGRDMLEPAEPQIAQVVDNGTLIWRDARNNDSDDVIEKVFEIV